MFQIPTYRSTRGGVSGLSFEEAVFEGLAPDGGLLVPEFVPDVSEVLKSWAEKPFHDLVFEIVSRYVSREEIPEEELRALTQRNVDAFTHPDVVPLVRVGEVQVMELFHGPTLSFKDVALQGLGNLYEYFLKRRPRRLTVLCATSGDTGSAGIHGLRGKEHIDCFVLFPEGRVSPIQQLQMTSVLDSNVHCVAVKGTFDDCQNIVKELMGDLAIKKKFGLGAVNSINWARIMFQVSYYFYTYFKLFPACDGKVSFSVPTGNFGDILAGYYAKRMGLPIENLVVATNSNDILHRFFTCGEYDKRKVQPTTAPSMDIGISSNFERYLFYLFGEDSAKLSDAMEGFKKTGQLHVPPEMREQAAANFVSASASPELIAASMKATSEQYGYMICPHTACGMSAVDQLRPSMQWKLGSGHELVVLATAHPAKFREAVLDATGQEPEVPESVQSLQGVTTKSYTSPNFTRAVHDTIERSLYSRGTYLHFNNPPAPERCNSLPGEPGMWLVALDVEGTLVGEAWLELQKKTGLEELKITTAHEPDYDKLMKYRIDVLRKNGIKLEDMKEVVRGMDPLEGCVEFLEWLKSVVPRVLLLTDTFEEYAMPLFDKLGCPSVFCNSLTVDEEGFITGHVLRLQDQKRKAVESFQRLNFRVISVGDSFNDVSMLKAAERGILMNPAAKVVQAHEGEFPICWDYDILKQRILEIVGNASSVAPKPFPVPVQLHRESASMWLIVANVAGTFAPDPWPALHAMTGIDALKTTTADVPDFDSLMRFRVGILKEHGIKLQNVFDKVKGIEPLPGALDFMSWLKPIVPRAFMVTDSFEEYALPIFHKLGHPMVFCNFLEADDEGFMARQVVRVGGQKRLAVEEFQRLNFRIIAIGSSFNDVPMMKAAEHGIVFKPSHHLKAAHPEISSAANYEELKARILQIVQKS